MLRRDRLGGLVKLLFMKNHCDNGDLTLEDLTAPLTGLLRDLKKALSARYIGYSDIEKRIRVLSFMKATYQGLEYKHDNPNQTLRSSTFSRLA